MWSGKISDIPSGWALCDGGNGTPDLRDKFIVGARQDDGSVAKTNVTGSLTQSGDGQIPSHSHASGTLMTNNAGAHTHTINIYGSGIAGTYGIYSGSVNGNFNEIVSDSEGIHSHIISGSTDSYGNGSKVIAVYYALAFIMKL